MESVRAKLTRGLIITGAFACSVSLACAQEGADQLKQNADKAQQVFDNTIEKPVVQEQGPKEEMPVFPGGEAALYAFLKKETKYPDAARDEGIVGKVFVQFIVEKDGRVDSVWVKRSVHPLLDAEALRVVSLLDGWTPGKQNDKPVRVHYMLPISFAMDAKDLERIRRKQARHAAKKKD